MIAVTGATGQLGGLILAGLKAKGVPAVALARDPAKAEGLGTEARAFDYDRPETLAPALAGVETLMLVSGSELGQRERQHKAVIAAAKAAGVTRIVYTSLLRADTSPISLAPEHVATEAALKASGLAYTILRNGWYTENYLPAAQSALQHGAVVGAAGEGRIASAARADYAAAAVAVLTGAGHDGATYELAGDDAWTLADLAAEVSRQTGRAIPFVPMTEAAYAGVLEQAGFPAPVAAVYAGFDAAAAEGALFDDGGDLSRLIGRPTTPLSEVLAASLPQTA